MELYTTMWEPSSGWTRPLPSWDGPGTLVMAFGATDLAGPDDGIAPDATPPGARPDGIAPDGSPSAGAAPGATAPHGIATGSALAELIRAFPNSTVTGCSTAGEIMADTVADGSLVVAVARFATTRLTIAHERVADPLRSYEAGLSLGKQLTSRERRSYAGTGPGSGCSGRTSSSRSPRSPGSSRPSTRGSSRPRAAR